MADRKRLSVTLIALRALWSLPLIAHSKSRSSEIAEVLHRPIRTLTFPQSFWSGVSCFLALAIPLDEPYQAFSVAYFFEISYPVPSNITYADGLVKRFDRRAKRWNIDRTMIYRVIENKLDSSGFRGHKCLLRLICEASEFSFRHNGLIGDLVHVIFTPSSSRKEGLPQDILQAEIVGRVEGCSAYRTECSLAFFNLIAAPL